MVIFINSMISFEESLDLVTTNTDVVAILQDRRQALPIHCTRRLVFPIEVANFRSAAKYKVA